jgi:hypothetical protein
MKDAEFSSNDSTHIAQIFLRLIGVSQEAHSYSTQRLRRFKQGQKGR